MSYQVTVRPSNDQFSCDENDVLLRAGLRAGLGMSYECNVGACGSCKFDLVEGDIEVLWEDAPGLTDRDKKRGRKLACQCRPKGDVTINMRLDDGFKPFVKPERFTARLVSVRALTPDMNEFTFEGKKPANFLAGQYALLELPEVNAPRAYSMSNLASEEGIWQFFIRKVPFGAGTTVLFEKLKEGDTITIDAPYGLAYFRPEVDRDIICIGGGSGLAPVVSIARAFAKESKLQNRKLYFFYGGRGPKDICSEPFLENLPGYGEHILHHAAVSIPEMASEAGWTGPICFVHELVEKILSAEILKNAEVYMAGPPPMIQSILEMLVSRYQVPQEQVHFDRFF
jgi:toluene monooxygenase electron transfer component